MPENTAREDGRDGRGWREGHGLAGNRGLHPYENASRMNEQRARENSAYVRKLLSEREPEFAAALAAAERYVSWSFRPGGDEDRDDDPYAAWTPALWYRVAVSPSPASAITSSA